MSSARNRYVKAMSLCIVVAGLAAGCGSDDEGAANTTAAVETSVVTTTASAETTAASETTAATETTAASETTADGTDTTAAGTDTTASAGSDTTAPGEPTGDPITLMVAGTIKSAIGDFSANVDGAEAAAGAINAAGGVGGHPIEIVQCNDEGDAAKAAQCAQQAVDTKVTAVVGSVIIIPAYDAILEAGEVPNVGDSAALPTDATSIVSYPLISGAAGEFSAMGGWAAGKYGKNLVLLAADAANGDFAVNLISATATAGGASLTTVKAPIGAPDFSPFASEVSGKDPDAVLLGLVPTDVVPAVAALRGQGYTGPIVAIKSVVDDSTIEALGDAADGIEVLTSWALPDVATSDLVQTFNAEMGEYSPDGPLNSYSQLGWSAVHVVAEALQDSSAVDAAALIEGLDGLEVDLVGFAGGAPFTLAPGSGVSAEQPRIFNPDVTVYVVKGGKFELLQDFYNPLTDPAGTAG